MSWFDHGASRISYEETGSGHPVLLLPGFSDSITRHAALRSQLSTRYRVIAADLPGSGRSGQSRAVANHSAGNSAAQSVMYLPPNTPRASIRWGVSCGRKST